MTQEGPEAACMFPGCDAAIDTSFQWKNLSVSWRNKEFKKLLNTFAMQRERDFLSRPDVQLEAAFEKRIVDNKDEIAAARDKRRTLNRERRDVNAKLGDVRASIKEALRIGSKNLQGLRDRRRALMRKKDILLQGANSLSKKIWYLEYGGLPERYEESVSNWMMLRQQGRRRPCGGAVSHTAASRPRFVAKCPKSQCKGILDDEHNCLLCKARCCGKCKELKEEGHVCSTDILENIERIKRSCKPCPNPACGTPIEKSYGCSQMWCPHCQTFFDWNTLKIVTSGPRHNPEYIRWVRETGGRQTERVEMGCGDPSYHLVNMAFKPDLTGGGQRATHWQNALQLLMHTRQEKNNVERSVRPYATRNRDLAVKHLAGAIDEKKWSSMVMKRNKEADTKKAKVAALDFLALALRHIIWNAIASWESTGSEPLDDSFRTQVVEATKEFNRQSSLLSAYQQVCSYKLEGNPDELERLDWSGAHNAFTSHKWKLRDIVQN